MAVAVVVLAVVVLAAGCGGSADDEVSTAAGPTSTTGSTAPTTTAAPAAVCDELAERYLDAFFALGAGTPRDPDADTVELPVADLLAIDREAADAGCADFDRVACSAYAELAAQGLEATNATPPANCNGV